MLNNNPWICINSPCNINRIVVILPQLLITITEAITPWRLLPQVPKHNNSWAEPVFVNNLLPAIVPATVMLPKYTKNNLLFNLPQARIKIQCLKKLPFHLSEVSIDNILILSISITFIKVSDILQSNNILSYFDWRRRCREIKLSIEICARNFRERSSYNRRWICLQSELFKEWNESQVINLGHM